MLLASRVFDRSQKINGAGRETCTPHAQIFSLALYYLSYPGKK